jgi:hypothetical protein
VNDLGVASLRARSALDAMSGGQSSQFLAQMSQSTRGLIADMSLAQTATKSLGLGIVETAEDAAGLVRIGTILGQTFRNNAAEGVDTLQVAMTRIGLTGLLDNIGISGLKVRQRFEELKKVMSEDKAWASAVLEVGTVSANKLAGSLDSVGTSLERVQTRFDNLKAAAAERVSIGIDATIRFLEDVGPGLAQKFPDYYDNQGNVWETDASGKPTRMKSGTRAGGPAVDTGQQFGPPAPPQYPVVMVPPRENAMTASERSARSGMASSQGYLANQQRGFMENNRIRENFDAANEAQMWEAAKARKGLDIIKNVLNEAGGIWDGLTGSLRYFVDTAKPVPALAQSISEAFNLRGGGIPGQLTGGLQDAAGQARQQVVKRYGEKSQQVAEFDVAAKQAVENYQIATGQATRDSLDFADATQKVNEQIASGRITVQQGAESLMALGTAAANAKNDVNALRFEMGMINDPLGMLRGGGPETNVVTEGAGQTSTTYGGKKPTIGDWAKGDGAGEAAKSDDPFGFIGRSADDAAQSIRGVGSASDEVIGKLPPQLEETAKGFTPIINRAITAQDEIRVITSLLKGMVGTLTINIGFKAGSGTSDRGGSPGTGKGGGPTPTR